MGRTGSACRGEGSQPVVRTKGRPPRKPGPSPRPAASGEVAFLWCEEAGEGSLRVRRDDIRNVGVNEERAPVLK